MIDKAAQILEALEKWNGKGKNPNQVEGCDPLEYFFKNFDDIPEESRNAILNAVLTKDNEKKILESRIIKCALISCNYNAFMFAKSNITNYDGAISFALKTPVAVMNFFVSYSNAAHERIADIEKILLEINQNTAHKKLFIAAINSQIVRIEIAKNASNNAHKASEDKEDKVNKVDQVDQNHPATANTKFDVGEPIQIREELKASNMISDGKLYSLLEAYKNARSQQEKDVAKEEFNNTRSFILENTNNQYNFILGMNSKFGKLVSNSNINTIARKIENMGGHNFAKGGLTSDAILLSYDIDVLVKALELTDKLFEREQGKKSTPKDLLDKLCNFIKQVLTLGHAGVTNSMMKQAKAEISKCSVNLDDSATPDTPRKQPKTFSEKAKDRKTNNEHNIR